nr:MAG TPA: hypothetical protein [Caudoviricetes sp.]
MTFFISFYPLAFPRGYYSYLSESSRMMMYIINH